MNLAKRFIYSFFSLNVGFADICVLVFIKLVFILAKWKFLLLIFQRSCLNINSLIWISVNTRIKLLLTVFLPQEWIVLLLFCTPIIETWLISYFITRFSQSTCILWYLSWIKWRLRWLVKITCLIIVLIITLITILRCIILLSLLLFIQCWTLIQILRTMGVSYCLWWNKIRRNGQYTLLKLLVSYFLITVNIKSSNDCFYFLG